MIVRIAVSPSGFDVDESDVTMLAAHERLLQLWREIGCMVEPPPKMIARLPLRLRQRWQEALRKHPTCTVQDALRLDDVRTLAEARALTNFDVGCLPVARYEALGGSGWTTGKPSPELCRLPEVDQAITIREQRELARRPITIGTSSDQLWTTRFRGLVQACRQHVVLLDRYCLIGRRGRDGLKALAQRLCDEMHPERSLTVFAAFDLEWPEQAAASYWADVIHPIWRRRMKGNLELFLMSTREFGTLAHDRYLRIDRFVCELGKGIEVLAGRVSVQTSFGLRPLDESTRRNEDILRRLSARHLVASPMPQPSATSKEDSLGG